MSSLVGLIRTMRPRQWTKNVLVFAGLVFDGQLFEPDPLVRVVVAFVLLCLTSSMIYIVNDLVDIESDRLHPVKKNRALPSGQLPVSIAIATSMALLLVAIGGAYLYSWHLAIILIMYVVLQLLYSFALKRIVIIDVMTLTAGFVLRVAAGVLVIQVSQFSPWLYACTALLALFLAIGKRRQELVILSDNAPKVREIFKEYNLPLLDDMLRIVTTSTLIAYMLYAIEAPTRRLANTNLALITVPFVLYALFRYLYLIRVRGEGSAPDEVLLRDHPLQLAIILWGLTFVVILYLVPGT